MQKLGIKIASMRPIALLLCGIRDAEGNHVFPSPDNCPGTWERWLDLYNVIGEVKVMIEENVNPTSEIQRQRVDARVKGILALVPQNAVKIQSGKLFTTHLHEDGDFYKVKINHDELFEVSLYFDWTGEEGLVMECLFTDNEELSSMFTPLRMMVEALTGGVLPTTKLHFEGQKQELATSIIGVTASHLCRHLSPR